MTEKKRDCWACNKCGRELEAGKVSIQYLGKVFSVELLKCANCGAAMVTEEIAVGKMAQAEEALEDK